MQSFLGETVPGIVRDIGADAERYRETQVPDFISAVEESGVLRHVFDEIRGAPGQTREYRYVDYPLPLGESIMLNHALAASALHAESAPVTDEPFHRTMLQYKLGQARGEVAAALHERARERGFANSIAAAQALRDPELGLPAFAPDVPLQAVIDYRLEHPEELEQVRRQLSHMTRAIRTKPWTPEFVEEVEHVLLPQLGLALEDARARRDAWLRGHRGRRVLTTIGLAAGTASTVLGLALTPTPLPPVGVGLAALGFGADAAVAQKDFVAGRTEAGSSLTYLIRPTGRT